MTYYSGYGYPQYYAPTVFSAPVSHEHHHHHHADGSQAGEDHHSQSVSGFAAPVEGTTTTFIYPPATTATYLPTYLPLSAPRVRRPGYNERLIAWRNRQKAFNRYKKATKEAIKNANKTSAYHTAFPTYYGTAPYGATTTAFPAATAFPTTAFAAPQVYSYGAAPFGAAPFGAAPFGATYLPYTFEQGQQAAPQQHQNNNNEQYATFGDFSQGGASAHQEQADEPEIRGTQV